MEPRIWPKQPWESEIYEIDCTPRLPSGVTVSSVEVKIFDSDGQDQSSTMIEGTPSLNSPYVYVQVKGGTDGEKYNVRVRITLSNGEDAEDDIVLSVAEKS